MTLIRKLTIMFIASIFSIAVQAHEKNIITTAEKNKELSTFVMLVKKAGLTSTLEERGPYTIFAPTDKAFSAVPKKDLDALLANPEQLKAILLYHVVDGHTLANQLKPGMIKTLGGQDLDIKTHDNQVFVNDTQVIQADIKASNGVIHIVDSVLMPKK